ncbi:sigma 54-interacting transcriptional regulator [Fodinisporobacter ferrooxydans]|uniref:Sigma 54-interacting transcriptional regulator n=1 Tax=Fodinisporobacter ferrooxydans TaxID=2901836 RepID=A0ABY4CK63_9BACL|nr:sigma 54-interacting transcriptional regulator [Alicyclobacillaceae bacterium MYW30-H2]
MIDKIPMETNILVIESSFRSGFHHEHLFSEIKTSAAKIVVLQEDHQYIGFMSVSDDPLHGSLPNDLTRFPWKPLQAVSSDDIQTLNFEPDADLLVIRTSGEIEGFLSKQAVANFLFDQLKTTQSFLDTLLDSVNDAVTCVDREGTVFYWNRVAEEFYGVPGELIIGKRIGDFFSQGSIMLFNILDEGRPIRHVYHHPRPDKHVLINAAPVYDGQKKLIGAVATEQDISQIVKVSEELMNRNSSEHMPDETSSDPFGKIKGCSHVIQAAVRQAKQLANVPIPILITGEKGVGKRLLAQAIHEQMTDHGEACPFLEINAATLPPSLIESELFGYQGNLFGGETQAKPGKIELAAGGSLLLDEVDDLAEDLQIKLAHLLEHGIYYRVGSHTPMPLQTKLMFTTVQPLKDLLTTGRFREDLYYQLERAAIHLPPLRERPEDILELSQSFLQRFAQQYHKPIPLLTPEVIAALTTYHWPGNVRQLRNTIERLVIFATDETIALDQLPPSIPFKTLDHLEQEFEDKYKQPTPNSQDTGVALQDMERSAILQALQKTAGNKAAAAKELGISRGTLYAKLRQLNIQDDI